MSFFKKNFGVWLIYSIVYSDSFIHIHKSVENIHISILFRFFIHIGHYRVLTRVLKGVS